MPGFNGGPIHAQVFRNYPLYRAPGMLSKFFWTAVTGFVAGIIVCAGVMSDAETKDKRTTRPKVTVTVTHEVIRDNP